MNYLQLNRDFDDDPRCQKLDGTALWVLTCLGRIAARDWGSVGDVELDALKPASLGDFCRIEPAAVVHGLTQLIASGAIDETPFGVCIHAKIWEQFGSETMRNRRRAEQRRATSGRQEPVRGQESESTGTSAGSEPSESPGTFESTGTNGAAKRKSRDSRKRSAGTSRPDGSDPVEPTSVGELLAGFRAHMSKRESPGSTGTPGTVARPTDRLTDRPTDRPALLNLAAVPLPLPIKPGVGGREATAVPSQDGEKNSAAADRDSAAPLPPLNGSLVPAADGPESAPDAPGDVPAPGSA